MIDDKKCCTIETHSIVQRVESGKTFGILNSGRRKIQVCRVDGCLINDEGKRCDYLFFLSHEKIDRIALVELKGIDISYAVEQLVVTAEALNLSQYGVKIESYIVSSSAPRATLKFQKAILQMSSRYKKAGVMPPQRKNIKHYISCD